jgi:arginyl-tRNA--protein-N-Asp/Glu arginylyltransferase
VARVLRRLVSPPRDCAYLPGRLSSLETRVMLDVTPEELQALLERGWRRFGPAYFRPACRGCHECVPVRVPVGTFTLSKNQRRVLQRARHIRVEVSTPVVDEQRLSLYRSWHRDREAARGWEHDDADPEDYAMNFCFPHPAAREFTYWEAGRLVAVGIADQTPGALSDVYCFHDPDRGALSLGTVNVLSTLAYARERSLAHVYLGYRVEGCASLRYKGRFRPLERLHGAPQPSDAPDWRPFDPAAQAAQ